MKKSFSKIISLTARPAIFLTFLIAGVAAEAAPLSEARVSQVIQDVRMLPSNAASRPATVNDKVTEGTAVRTGAESRAELTFTDLTITRLGANTVFSLNGAREIDLVHGSVLVQVPSNGAPAKVTTAAVSAAISGGTALFGTGPPVKFMVLEGVGTFYPAGHPELAVTVHGGEMVMLTADGHITQPQTFDVKTVVETSGLIVGFPDLANLPLILEVMDQQQVDQSTAGSSPPPSKDVIDVTSQNVVANPTTNSTPSGGPPSGGPPSEFGPPPTISSPDPYLITSGTTIQTDPTITTNGVTDFGTLYRGTALDGSPSEFLFGEAPTAFDQLVFSGSQNNLPVAVFKFAHLELTGDPTVTVPSGATTNLALVSVGDITSGGPGATLTFAGITRLDFITQNGSINLGSEISFSGIDHLTFYARGSSSNLTLASPISNVTTLKLFSEGTIQVNGDESVTNFQALSGGDFLAGTGMITATNIDIESLSNINIDGSKFPNPPDNSGSVLLNAANTLNIAIVGGGQPFGWDTLTAQATTINLTSPTPVTFDFSNSSSVAFTAGTGGIQAPNIDFSGSNLTLTSGADINVGSITKAGAGEDAIISAATSFNASGDVQALNLTAGTTVTTGGFLVVYDTLTAGGNINVGDFLQATTINAPSSILTVQNGIAPNLENSGAALQHTFNVDSIVSPEGIDFSGNQFGGIAGLSSGGLLTINATTITFDSATGIAFANFNGADAGAFGGGSPSEGGDGGTFIVNTTGNITANQGADITATTGNNASGDFGFYGAGGTVKLISSGGSVTVDDIIQVSSDDPIPEQTPAPPIRRSASGGTILLQSNLTTGQGITVGANAQLLSLLDPNAPGPGGSITLSTMGADITVNGIIEADLGTITIDQNDPVGATPLITIDGATLTSETLNISGAGDVNIGLNSPVTINAVTLSLSAANNLNWSGGTLIATATNSDGNVSISAGQAINITNSLDIERTNNGRTSGLNITLNAGTDLSVGGNLSLTTDASNIETGGNIVVTSGGDMTIGGNFTLRIAVVSGTTTGVGGNINVTSGGSLTAGSLYFDLFFDPSAQVTNGENLTLTVSNDLITTAGGVTLVLSTPVGPDRPPLMNGGNVSMTIGGNLMLASGGNLDLEMINAGITEVPTGGNIFASIGGNLSANQINGYLTNSGDSIIGTGGNLTFSVGGDLTASGLALQIDNSSNGNITTGGNLNFHVGGDMNLGSNGTFELTINNSNGGVITDGGDITASIGGSLTTGSVNFLIDNSAGGHIGSSGNIYLTTGSDLTASGDAAFTVQNTSGQIDNGGNLTLALGGNVHVNSLSAYVENYDETTNPAGHIGTGGNIDVQVNGNLTTDSYVDVFLNNRGGGVIDSGGNLTFNVSGALTIGADSSGFSSEFIISSRYDDTGGNTSSSSIGSSATLYVHAASISMAGDLFGTGISNRGGSVIDGNATATWDVTGNLTIQGTSGLSAGLSDADWFILNDAAHDAAAQLTSPSGGTINGNATLTLTVGGDVNMAGDISFEIANERSAGSTAASGGSILGDAAINISAASFSVGGELDVDILNNKGGSATGSGGSITGNATINLNVAGNFAMPGTDTNSSREPGGAFFEIWNFRSGANGSGGFIGGDASVILQAGSIGSMAAPVADFEADILNFNGGTINGNATVQIGTTGDMTANSLFVFIENYNGGMIGGNATVDLHTLADVTTGNLDMGIQDYNAGHIAIGANLNLAVGGNLTVTQSGPVNLYLNSFNGGTIGTNSDISATIGGNLAAGSFVVGVQNQASGSIGGSAGVTMNITGGLTTTSNTSSYIDNFDGGTIGGNANILASIGGDVAAGQLDAGIQNQGGSIGSNANVTIGITGGLTTTAGDASFYINNFSGGSIGSDATITINAASISTGGSLSATIDNTDGTIGGNANIDLESLGNVTVGSSFYVSIDSTDGQINNGGNIDVEIGGSLNAGNVFMQGYFVSELPQGAGENLTLNVANDLMVHNTDNSGGIDLEIITPVHQSLSSGANLTLSVGGNLVTDQSGDTTLLVNNNINQVVNGANITATVGGNLDTNNLLVEIANEGGEIDTGGNIAFAVSGNLTTQGSATFLTDNYSGNIGGDAAINVSAANISTVGNLYATIDNTGGGQIGGSATIDITTVRALVIGDVLPSGNINADYMQVQIDNTNGTIGGNAAINMNVGGIATVTNDATVQILGNDPTGAAAINFNGGDYEVGGTFRSTIDGKGTIAFNSTTVTADTIKVGVFGTNGILTIGSGPLTANTLMKLYATGTSGTIDFTASTFLTCKAAAIILAANTVTIDQNVIVTILGGFTASVYTNIANYSNYGGTCSTCGSFGGAGVTTSPLGGQPAFDDPPTSSASRSTSTTSSSTTKLQSSSSTNVASSSTTKLQSSSGTKVASSSNVTAPTRGTRLSPSLSDASTLATRTLSSAKTTTASSTINVRDSGQLLSLLDSATPSSNGKIMITSSKGDGVSNNLSRNNPNLPNAASGLSHDRSAAENHISSKASVALLDHTPPPVR